MTDSRFELSNAEDNELNALLDKLPTPKGPMIAIDCATYREYRPFLVLALKIVAKLPHGAKIVSVITMLMGLADQLCPE